MWSNKYIGIPFLDKGRDINGIDCWGLVRLVYRQEYNIDLPNFSSEYEADDTERMRDLIAQYKEGWEQIDVPTEGCIVLFNIMGTESHIGIAVSNTHFLHARDGRDSAIESFESVGWKKRISGYFKYSENKNVILNAVPHPLRTERFTIPVLPGTTIQQLADWIKKEYNIADELASKITILVNGRVIAEENWVSTKLKDTDKVEYRAVPGKGNTLRLLLVLAVAVYAPILAGQLTGYTNAATWAATMGTTATTSLTALNTAVTIGLNIAGAMLVNAIAPVRPPSAPDSPGSSERQLMVTGGANQINPYGAIPVVLGKIKMTPPLGAVNNLAYENETESYLSMLLIWGYGPLVIDQATLKIGEVSISEYTLPRPVVTLDRRTEPTAQQILDFNAIYGKDVNQVVKNITLVCDGEYDAVLNESTFGPWIVSSSGPPAFDSNGAVVPISQFTVSLHFPQGLRRIQAEGGDSGKEESAYVKYEIQIKNGDGPWTVWEDSAIGDGTVKKDGFTINKTFYDLNSTNEVQVRVRRKTGDNPEWTKNANGANNVKSQIYAQMVLLQTTFLRNTAPVRDPLNCKLAGTALKIKANDQLNGQIEGINAIVQTWAPSWNGTSWQPAATNNPADLFLYILKHPANPQRVKDSEVSTKINLQQIQYWHQYCVSKGFQFNSVLASQRSILEVLRDICAAGRASPAMLDGKWSVVIDEPKSNIVQHFSPHNSWGFEGTKALPRLPDGLKVSYYDEDQDYQQAEIIVYNTGKNANNSELFESISLPGVTKKSLAIDHARWHFAQAKLRPEVYRLNSDIEYLVCNRGDRVKVMHDVPMWGIGSGRVKTKISPLIFELDEPVQLDASKTYTIRFRSSTGASVERTVNMQGVQSGEAWTITVTSAANEILPGDLFLFGEFQNESQDLMVLSIEPSSNKSAILTMVDYGVTDTYNIFTDYLNLTQDIVFESQITLPGEQLRNGFGSTDTPIVTNIVSDNSASKLLSVGTYEQRINISYANPQTLSKLVDKVQCSYYLQNIQQLINPSTTSVDYNTGSVYISGVERGQTYKLKLRYLTKDGRAGPWGPEYTHTVGQLENFLTVQGVDIDLDNHTLYMTPVTTTPLNTSLFKSYEYRIYRDTGTEDFWDIVPNTSNQIKVVKSTGIGQVSLLDFTGIRLSTSGVTYRVACRTIDIHDNYSTMSALGTIVIKTIQ
jgi:hypothetical protein